MGDSGAKGKGSGPEGRIRRTALTRAMRRQLSLHTARRLKEVGHEPYKQSSLDKKGRKSSDYDPDLQARWIFPTIGLSRAARVAQELSIAGKGRDLSNLRLVTLKLKEDKPKPDELNSHLDDLSESINTHVPYIKSMGWVEPVLSVPQIRVDRDGRLDPHLHALWDIAPEHLAQVREYLELRYTGGVWIDDEPVRSLKKATFYIASGMLDYPEVPTWPTAILVAIWELKRRRMIRPAGWYAAYLKTLGGAKSKKPPVPRRLPNSPEGGQGASGAALGNGDGWYLNFGEKQLPRVGSGPSAPNRENLSSTTLLPASARRRGANISTVRPAAPDSEHYNPFSTPSIDVFWIVVRLLQSMNDGKLQETFDEFCTRLSLKPSHARKAVSQVEAHIEASLFYPGGYWSPTPSGISFLERALPYMQGLDMLTVELGADAIWARTAGRREFEERIGMRNYSVPPETDINSGDGD